MSPERRTVMITGAAGHLGAAVAAAFRALGCQLVLVDRDAARLEAIHGPDTERIAKVRADLGDRLAAQAAAADGVARFRRIDVLCHLAGAFDCGAAVHEAPDGLWDRLHDINVRTLVHVASAVVPGMLAQGSGHVVTVGAHSSLRGLAGMGPYCAAKDAVLRITESMSAELRGRGIHVNAVLPSIIDTPPNRAAMPQADPSCWVAPDALADVICFLASPGARAVHGVGLPVTGLV